MINNYAKSLEMLDNCLSANPKNIPAHSIKVNCLLKLGRFGEVINYYNTIPSDVVVEGEKTGAIALAYSFKKDSANAFRYLEKLKAQAKEVNGFTADSYLFLMYVVSGAMDKAFEWVAQPIEKHSSLLLLRYTDPLVDALKNDPRYETFLKIIYQTGEIEEVEEQKTALLDAATTAKYSDKLFTHLSEVNPFLNPSLSLRSLAREIEIHPNHLSWLLNNSIGKNFNEFINHYRIEYFKKLALNPDNSHISLLGLAYESGFNSKSVFNTYFKKETGKTPKEFLKQNS
jgi:YesN/AraC family two-component response regulator